MGKRIRSGAIAGILGGVVFGMLMAMMGMLGMIAGMVGSSSAAVGFLVHLMISAFIGAVFAVLLDRFTHKALAATISGIVYGMFWWVLGPLTLMPLMMGMGLGTNWSAAAAKAAMPSLMGHVIYGAILGFAYYKLPHGHDRAAGLPDA